LSAFAKCRRAIHHTGGAAAVEFAMIFPALVLVIVGIVVGGWTFNCVSSLRLALEASGRALEINPNLTVDDLTTIAKTQLASTGDPNVTLSLASDTSVSGVQMTRITGSYSVSVQIPFLPAQQVSFQTSIAVPATVT
jgi:Flp pilus assembly protein TadG